MPHRPEAKEGLDAWYEGELTFEEAMMIEEAMMKVVKSPFFAQRELQRRLHYALSPNRADCESPNQRFFFLLVPVAAVRNSVCTTLVSATIAVCASIHPCMSSSRKGCCREAAGNVKRTSEPRPGL